MFPNNNYNLSIFDYTATATDFYVTTTLSRVMIILAPSIIIVNVCTP